MAQRFEIIDAFRQKFNRDPSEQEIQLALPLSVGQLNDSGNLVDIAQRAGPDASAYIAKKKQDVINNAIAQRKITDFENVDKYLKDNPLTLDDLFLEQTKQLVREQVLQEPYYKEKLSNYLEDVETQRERAQEDTDTIISEINRKEKEYLTTGKINYQQTREAALEGLTDTGLLGTGKGQRDLNLQGIERQNKLDSYLSDTENRRDTASTELKRTQEDLGLGQKRFETDLEREKQLRIETEIQQRKQEELDKRQTAFKQYTSSNVAPDNYSSIINQYL